MVHCPVKRVTRLPRLPRLWDRVTSMYHTCLWHGCSLVVFEWVNTREILQKTMVFDILNAKCSKSGNRSLSGELTWHTWDAWDTRSPSDRWCAVQSTSKRLTEDNDITRWYALICTIYTCVCMYVCMYVYIYIYSLYTYILPLSPYFCWLSAPELLDLHAFPSWFCVLPV